MVIEPDLGPGAVISPCERYRFLLWRVWNSRPRILFIGINPSTADSRIDDATVRRCMSFAAREKCGGMELVNLFAERSTDPRMLSGDAEPAESDTYIRAALARCNLVVAAWGNAAHKVSLAARKRGVERENFVVAAAAAGGRDLLCLGTTLDGWPRHPLFVTRDKLLEIWERPEL